MQWELNRFVELQRIQKKAVEHGFNGMEVDTTKLSAKEVVEVLWKDIFNSQAA